MGKKKQFTTAMTLLLLAAVVAGCSGDVATDDTPVFVTASATPRRTQVDISTDQEEGFVDVTLQVLPKRADAATDQRFLTVQFTRYRVSFSRSDGGTTVPRGFTAALPSTTVTAGGTATITNLPIFDPNAFTQAPFAALLAQNGGVDPETGQRFVKLTATIEIFGETLAGDNVSAFVQVPFTFCNGCGNITP